MTPEAIDPNKVIRGYVENGGATEWKHKETAEDLYKWGDVFRYHFFSPASEGDYELPQPLVAIAPMDYRTLAAYRLKENPLGLRYEIIMNEVYIDRPKWELLETLLHEMVHLYQENAPDRIRCKPPWHSQEFVDICEEIGLHPMLGVGAHWKPADGQFEALVRRFGVEKPDYAEGIKTPPESPKGKKGYWWDDDRKTGGRKGTSTLVLYTSDKCVNNPPCKIRSGRRDLEIACKKCGGEFKPQS